jgi:glycosyltransferase involved in cell wall biosynthesis
LKGRSWTVALDATYSVGRNLSGVGVYSREIAQALAQAHPETKFLMCYRPHRFLRAPRSRRRLLWDGFPHGVDLFHGLNQRLDHRYRRSVSTFHDLFVLTSDYSTPEFRKRFAEQAHHAAERSDLVITVSEFTACQVEDLLKVERSRIRVIPHGVRVPHSLTVVARNAFTEPRASASVPSDERRREQIILFVGAIQKRKNVRRLVEAFERTPGHWKLVLAGSLGYGSEEELQAVERSTRRSDITITGYIDDDDLERLYARASILAFPSLDEGFGLPVLEAMARGLPVLTSNRSALPEVAGDAALLVDPLDTESISTSLNHLIEDQELRKELSGRGLRRSKNYTWEHAANETWTVYGELLR